MSLPTVRNDLNVLEKSGKIIRTFGGAILNEKGDDNGYGRSVLPFSSRLSRNYNSKVEIGKLAASLVSPFDVIFLDAGTTVFQILKEISSIDHLVVLTNSINICTCLMEIPRVSHYLIGGSVKPASMATIGQRTIDEIRRNKVNKVFLGCDGLSDNGFTVQDINEAMTKLAMIDIATKRYLLVDTSKINRSTFVDVAGLDVLDAIITEKGIYYINKRYGEEIRTFFNENVNENSPG